MKIFYESKSGKMNPEISLLILILLITSVAALQGVSSNYTSDSKLDFGATDNSSSTSYSNRFIEGFEPVGNYLSELYAGRFGALGDSSNVSTTDPVIVNILINSTDGTNRTQQDLHCSATLLDANGDSMNVSVNWYNNSVEVLSQEYNNNYPTASKFVADLYFGNTSKGQNWSCAIRAFDGDAYGSWVYSEGLTIENTPPTITLTAPSSGSLTTNRTPSFNWTGGDVDNDTLTYDFNISLVPASLCMDSNQFVEDISVNRYTSSVLNCFFDNGDYYIWSVRAKDGYSTGEWADYFAINLSALIDISVPVDSVTFGTIPYLGSNNTTNNSPPPFIIQNNGNSFINLNISATSLWEKASNPTDYYKLKIDNVSSEKGAFNWTGSNINWINVSTTNNTLFINKLNYLDSIDSAEVDVYVEVPVNETPTAKTSTVTFVSSFAE